MASLADLPRSDQEVLHGKSRISTLNIKEEEEEITLGMLKCEEESGLPDHDQPVQLAQLTSNGLSFLVPIPPLEENLETTFQKVQGLANAVANGGVLTFVNGQTHASHQQPDAEAVALAKKRHDDTLGTQVV